MYIAKTTRAAEQQMGHAVQPAATNIAPPTLLSRLLNYVVCFILHVIAIPCCAVMLLLTVVTLSHRALRVILLLYGMRKRQFFTAPCLKEAFHFQQWDNPILTVYSTIMTEFGMLFIDGVFLIMTPYLAWFFCVLTVYRLPFIYDRAKDTTNSDSFALAVFVVNQAVDVLKDLLAVVLCLVPILVTFHRTPHLCSRLRGLSYRSDWPRNLHRSAVQAECCEICICVNGDTSDQQQTFDCCCWDVVGQIGAWLIFILLGVPVGLLLLVTCTHHSLQMVHGLIYHKQRQPMALFFVIMRQLGSLLADIGMLGLPILSCWLVILTVYRIPLLISRIWAGDPTKAHIAEHSIFVFDQAGEIVKDVTFTALLLPVLVLTCHRIPHLIQQLSNLSYSEGVTQWASLLIQEVSLIGQCDCGNDIRASLTSFFTSLIGFVLLLPMGLLAFLCGVLTLVTCSHRAVVLVRFFNLNSDWKPWRVISALIHSAMWVLLDVALIGTPYLSWYVTLQKRK